MIDRARNRRPEGQRTCVIERVAGDEQVVVAVARTGRVVVGLVDVVQLEPLRQARLQVVVVEVVDVVVVVQVLRRVPVSLAGRATTISAFRPAENIVDRCRGVGVAVAVERPAPEGLTYARRTGRAVAATALRRRLLLRRRGVAQLVDDGRQRTLARPHRRLGA